jgi:hypothetical protein
MTSGRQTRPGDPSPGSPRKVVADRDYEEMRNFVRGHFYPSAEEIVVKHKSSGTFWRAIFQVRDDDDDSEYSAKWTEVRPEQEIVTKYVPVKP